MITPRTLLTVTLLACASLSLQSTNSSSLSGKKAWNPKEQGIGDLTEEPPGAAERKERVPLPTENIFFTEEAFAVYVKNKVYDELHRAKHWHPSLIVLHNTYIPSIAMRPSGFSKQDMVDLDRYYGEKGWTAGPAAFVDQNGIWVFSGFLKPGVHSPSWNSISWGIEQLGDFDHDPYKSGDGAKIRSHVVAMLAILSIAGDIPLDSETLRLHKEDKHTTHDHCPGSACKKDDVLAEVEAQREHWKKFWDALDKK